jgi:4-carboxymuconolactone decarboxylase
LWDKTPEYLGDDATQRDATQDDAIKGELMQTGRLPWLSSADLDSTQAALHESIAGGPRSQSRAIPLTDDEGRLYGPFNAMLHEPIVGAAVSELGVALRYRSLIPARMREVAINEVAATCRSEFEWFAHATIARELGISEEDLDAIRTGAVAPGLEPDETLARHLAHELVTKRDLDDGDYEAGVSRLGLPVFVDLVVLVGFYATIATTLATFRVPLPPGFPTVF